MLRPLLALQVSLFRKHNARTLPLRERFSEHLKRVSLVYFSNISPYRVKQHIEVPKFNILFWKEVKNEFNFLRFRCRAFSFTFFKAKSSTLDHLSIVNTTLRFEKIKLGLLFFLQFTLTNNF